MAIPTAAGPIADVDRAGRVHDLAEQTSQAFGAWSALIGGSWELRIRAPEHPRAIAFKNLKSKLRSPAERVAAAKAELAAALQELYPDVDDWRCPEFEHSEMFVGMYMITGRTEVRS